MPVKNFKYLSLILATLLTTLQASSSEESTEILIVSDEWQGFVNQQGEGYYLDILEQIFPKPQYTINLVIFPYARALKQVQYNKADIVLGIWANEHPSSQLSQYPVEIDLLDAAMPIEHFNPEAKINTKFFNQLRVLAKVGYQVDELLDQPQNYSEYVNIDRMLKMLASDRADALIDYRASLEPAITHLGLEEQLTVIDNVLTEYVYFGFCSTKHCRSLRQRFDREYLKLYQQGAIKQHIINNHQSLDIFPPLIPVDEVLNQ